MKPFELLRAERGVTVVELLVAMVVSGILMAGAVSLFTSFQVTAERQAAVRDVQTEAHRAVEAVVDLVRNAEEIGTASTDELLAVTGGRANDLCGNTTCWIERTDDGLAVRPPDGEVGTTWVVAPDVVDFQVLFGVDDDDNGTVDDFEDSLPGGSAEDVLAVQLFLSFDGGAARGRFQGDVSVVAALRAKIIERIALEG